MPPCETFEIFQKLNLDAGDVKCGFFKVFAELFPQKSDRTPAVGGAAGRENMDF